MKRKRSIFHYGFLLLILAFCFVFPITVSADTKQVPGKVELTKISAPAYNRIRIQWENTTDATHYRIYYRKTGEKKWTFVRTVSKDITQYTHLSNKKRPIIVGQKYDYTVRAYNKIDDTYGKYDTKGLTIRTKPATPKIKSIELTSNKAGVSIEWDKTPGCDKYLVYRKAGSGKWERLSIKPSSNRILNDLMPVDGKRNYYTVRGYNSKNRIYSNYNKNGVGIYVPKKNNSNTSNENVPIRDFDVHNKDFVSMKLNEQFQVDVKVVPANASKKQLKWESSNPSVAVVDDNGLITVKGDGIARIVASLGNNPMHRKGVTVVANGTNMDAFLNDMLRRVNKERAEHGSSHPLKLHPLLTKAAMIRAKDISIKFAHERPDGSDINTACWEVGIGSPILENCGKGHPNAKEAMKGWMNSYGHRKAILSNVSQYLGVGCYGVNENFYWVLLFGEENIDKKYTITLDTMGGNPLDPIIKLWKQPLKKAELPIPTKPGYKFGGWYADKTCLNPFYGVQGVTFSETAYAKWIPE